jgi:hypothetical protein
VNEPKTALRVRQGPAGQPRQLAAHPSVHLPAQPGNFPRIVHAVADHQTGSGSFGAPKQRRQILRRVLAVAVERHRPFATQIHRARQSRFERRTFAQVALVPDHDRAGNLCEAGRRIRRAVVHDQHGRELPAHRRNQRRDAGGLVEARNHGGAGGRFNHADSLKWFPPGIEAKLDTISFSGKNKPFRAKVTKVAKQEKPFPLRFLRGLRATFSKKFPKIIRKLHREKS